VFFPFDLFGSAGASSGTELLAEAFQELCEDNRRERVHTRARSYASKVTTRHIALDTVAAYHDWRDLGREAAGKAIAANQFLIWVTGNHLGVLPVYDELAAVKRRIRVIQLDAHLDVYNLSDCKRELSHGNYLMHCAGPLPPIINIGSRELLLEKRHWKGYFEHVITGSDLAIDEASALGQLRMAAESADQIFLDLDCDVLDPAYFPATTHPQPFGISPHQLLRILDAVWSDRVMGIAFSEFDPARDQNDKSLSTLTWLLEYLLLKRYEPGIEK
jgi:arginase family enzyme